MKNTILQILSFALLFSIISCVDKSTSTVNLLCGTWEQTSLTIDGEDKTPLFEDRDYLEINANGILRYKNGKSGEISRSGWSYKDNMLNISIFMPIGYYIDQIDNTTLILRSIELDSINIIKNESCWRRLPEGSLIVSNP